MKPIKCVASECENTVVNEGDLCTDCIYAKNHPYCCLVGCISEARWEVRHGTGIEEYTHSCTKHISEFIDPFPELTITLTPISYGSGGGA